MRWPAFLILAYLTISVQMGLGGFVDWKSASPNLVLPVVVFVAINARREESLLVAFALGALQDLFTQQPLGVYAFSYGLVALFIVGAQPALYRDHPLTHFSVTLVCGLMTGAIVLFYEWAYARIHSEAGAPGSMIGHVLASALYTALLAVPMLAVLVRLKPLFGFSTGRHSTGHRHLSNLSFRE